VSNVNDMPNCIHASGDRTFGSRFGSLVSCRPVNLAGIGHHPHIEARFQFGIRLELDQATAAEFARQLAESVKALPVVPNFKGANVSGALAEIEAGDG
jgi:hypothetical protein